MVPHSGKAVEVQNVQGFVSLKELPHDGCRHVSLVMMRRSHAAFIHVHMIGPGDCFAQSMRHQIQRVEIIERRVRKEYSSSNREAFVPMEMDGCLRV
jgi:hypothetical protein